MRGPVVKRPVYSAPVEAVPFLATFVGLVWLTWRRHRRGPRSSAGVGVLDNFDVDAAVAIHVAHREATERALPVAPAHLLYGLLQVEAFTAALHKLGADPTAIEARVLAALGDKPREPGEALQLEAHASLAAQHEGRQATCTDLWYRLARTSAASFVDNAHALLFQLVHGMSEPPCAHADPEVHVVIRNDDYTPMRFVSYVIHAIFERSPEDAVAVMKTAHEHGRAIIGRLPTPRAVELVTAARAKARESGYPLWLELEPW
jgi:ATP-dependent Clp protease adapter protein ClpS